jgi:hypothetical protein
MFRELEITYQGKTHRVKPTMDLIRRLELAQLSPFEMAGHVHRRDQCFAIYASFVAEILRYAGADVTDDQIYATLTSSDNMLELVALVQTLVAAILPPSPVPVDGGTGAPAKKTQTRSANGSRRPRSS